MKFGVALPTAREGLFYPIGFASPSSLQLITQKAEELGYDSVWGNDHVTTQRYIRDRGEKPNFFEPLIVFSNLAAITRRIRLGTSVIVAPIRNPVVLAKQAITLDHISNGRFTLGIGLGAYREEFEACGYEGNRGKILDEIVIVLRNLFDKPIVSFAGDYIRIKEVEMYPRPLQKPFPLYLGGNSFEVLRRVALYGNGWTPAALTHEELEERIQKIRYLAKEANRGSVEFEIAPEFGCSISDDSSSARKTFLKSLMYEHLKSLRSSTLKEFKSFDEEELIRRNFIGSPDDIIRKIELYEAVGVNHLWFDFIAFSVKELIQKMEFFAKDVLPSFKHA
jgi:probable F420-dependent oxidoreductase